MKQGKTLTQLAAEIERQANTKMDMVVNTRLMEMDNEGCSIIVNGDDEYSIGEIAHQQISKWAGIPWSYYRRIQGTDSSLLAYNVNSWLKMKAEPRMIRVLDNQTRAYLSNRYRRIDNDLVANAALTALQDKDVEIASSEVTENHLYIKALFPKMEEEVKKGDVVQLGVVVENSEVGLGTVSVSPLVYRMVCTNGLIMNDAKSKKYKKSHIGSQIMTEEVVLRNETIEADNAAMFLTIQDVINTFTDSSFLANTLGQLQDAAQSSEVSNPVAAIELLSKNYNLKQGEIQSVIESFVGDRDYSKWGMANAVTQIANETHRYDRATELELMGGKIIDMPSSQWDRYVSAEVN